MDAEIVAVGTELLLGDAVDTNSAWLSSRLAEIGVGVYRHTTVGDNVERLEAVIADACARSDVVVVTGGLGPTQDDLTRVAVARVAGVPLERRAALVAHVEEAFRSRGRTMPANNLVQADLPAGATVIAPVGTAAGFAIDVAGARVVCLPGVPREMQRMAADEVIPGLAALAGTATTVSRLVRTAGLAESAVAETLGPLVERLDGRGNPTIAFLASRGETRVRVTGSAPDRPGALALIDPVVEEIVDLLGAGVAGLDDEGPAHAVVRLLERRGWTIACAESMTGGAVCARLVTVPGASAVVRGGLVTYASEVKETLAGVNAALLAHDGPVSASVATVLAEAASERLAADVGVGVVGVAGPETQGGVAVGTVHVAVALPDGSTVHRRLLLPARSREDVIEFATSAVIDLLRRRLAELGAPAGDSHG